MSAGNMPDSSNTDDHFDDPAAGPCRICGGEPICGGLGVVRYSVPIDDPRFGKLFRCPNNPAERDTERRERLRRLSHLGAYSEKTFDSFVINPATLTPSEELSLQMALRLTLNFAQNLDGWLLLEGGYGCGKTHLAAAVGNHRLAQGDMVLFMAVPDLLDHLRSTFGPTSETGYDEMFDRIRGATVLILDDLGAENASPWAQEKLFQLLNHRYAHRLPTVITTNVDLDLLDGRIRSRLLDENLIHRAKITAPDYRTTVRNQRDQVSNLSLYTHMTFENFDLISQTTPEERQNLRRVFDAAQDYARQPQGWFVLTGGYGTGKTHLAAAIANQQQRLGTQVIFATVPDLLDYLRFTYSPGAPVSFDQRFQMVRNVPLLVLDDLGTESSSAWAREKLFQIIDHRYLANLPTVITTAKMLDDDHLDDKKGDRRIDERLVIRLIDRRRCTIFAITGRSYAERISQR